MVILVISTYGTKIGKTKELFKITRPQNEFQEELFPAEQVEEIIVESTGSISNGAIALASRYAIPILYMKGNQPLACIHPFVAHGTVQVRREQIKAYDDERGIRFVERLLKAATENKMKIIKEMVRVRRLEILEEKEIEKELVRINILKDDLTISSKKIDDCRGYFFAREAEITKRYYNCIKLLIKGSMGFKGRTRRPPRDPVNALLSYGYAVLTAQIHKAVIIAGLEPYAGFLHTDRSGKISFVFDIIELFRQPVIDRLVFTLIERKMMKKKDFEGENGVKMKENTKKQYLEYLFERMRSDNVKYKGKKTSFMKIFVDQVREVGLFFRGLKREFECFKM